jgi:hypothetical protein
MVEKMIKMLKHGFNVVCVTNIYGWAFWVPRILFGYRCGTETKTKYSLYMILTRRTLRLIIDNMFNNLMKVIDHQIDPQDNNIDGK